MRTPFIAGNWKMNTLKASAIELAKAVAQGSPRSGVDVGVAPPFVYLDAVSQVLAGSPVLLGAQDAFYEKSGAFTGEISVDQLKDVGVKFCLTGHSERRHVLGESPELVGKKARAVYNGGLILVHCVGEKLDERDSGKTLAVVEAQLKELDPKSMADPQRLVIAYEPVWAIGTGRNATDAQAQEVHAFIRQTLGKIWNPDFAAHVRIQYGGSMKPENAKGLLDQPDVDGGLIGGAALKADSFLAIVKAAE
ncbi:MAG: pgk tpi [Phycisphaerales bacterium]|jgi:triosephosphate isomerase (TIM)|nr:pgk tpi [Phycisphaerales bacterium]MDB5356772.1 pgk tpi [Phycisphaerales bacterium]